MIDLDHLARQTAGDTELTQELLTLFLTQLDGLDRLLDSEEERGCDNIDKDLPSILHRIRGAAVAIGANGYASILAKAEDARLEHGSPTSDLAALRSATRTMRAELTRLVAAHEATGLAKARESR